MIKYFYTRRLPDVDDLQAEMGSGAIMQLWRCQPTDRTIRTIRPIVMTTITKAATLAHTPPPPPPTNTPYLRLGLHIPGD